MKKNLNIMRLISTIIINVFFIYTFINLNNNLFMLPFILFGIFSLGGEVSLLLNNAKFARYFKIAQDLSFLILWYGILIFLIYLSVSQKEIILVIFSIPFWVAGLLVIKPYLKNK